MFEKVNPAHPDKVADRIAGAMVDLAYQRENNPKVAVEVLIGHGYCYIIAESSVKFTHEDVIPIVNRISGATPEVRLLCVPQDQHLAKNQEGVIRCGDNGIFKGVPVTEEQRKLCEMVGDVWEKYPTDGKFILADGWLVACQSNVKAPGFIQALHSCSWVNPLGPWTGGIDVDSGATNRKLGSDMGDSVTGGGLHGKDLSKADVSVNIYAWLKAQQEGRTVEFSCAIGDGLIGDTPYGEVVEVARNYINSLGGFEKFAEWGLIRPDSL